jgi:hypothetical protein
MNLKKSMHSSTSGAKELSICHLHNVLVFAKLFAYCFTKYSHLSNKREFTLTDYLRKKKIPPTKSFFLMKIRVPFLFEKDVTPLCVWLPLLRDHFVMFPFAQVSRGTRRVIWRRRGTVGGGGRNVQRSGNKENRTKMGFTRNMSACRVYISPLI